MISYRFRRRTFLTALSGGVGLKIMLRNLESSATGMKSPGRLLVSHWPTGIVAGQSDSLWRATSGSVGGSVALKPFEDRGLGPDMTVLRGLSTASISSNGAGGAEGGVVKLMTGRAPGGTRANCCEADDGFAAGPSIDQLLLKNVPGLQTPGGFANAIADSRTDVGEISAQCLSYSNDLQSVNTYSSGTTAMEATPLRPVLSPLVQFINLFQSFVPGTGTGGTGGASGQAGRGGGGGGGSPRVADAMLKKLVGRRSVLDFAVAELNQLRTMVPSESRAKLAIHTDAVLAAERSVLNAINTGYPNTGAGGSGGGTGGAAGVSGAGGSGAAAGSGGGTPACGGLCGTRPTTPPNVTGLADPSARGSGNAYGNPVAMKDDAPLLEQVGKLHLAVLKAGFVCDLLRVGTFQWCSANNHVGFALHPTDTVPYKHHPMSHRISTVDTLGASTLAALNPVAQFLFNVHTWFFSRQAEVLAEWKSSLDGCGNRLLDFTCVPFLTEVAATGHEHARLPAMIIGGKALGFTHGRYVTDAININQFWGTIAQAFGHTSTDAPFAAPVAGFWTKP